MNETKRGGKKMRECRREELRQADQLYDLKKESHELNGFFKMRNELVASYGKLPISV